ncbi:DUF1697 domain-containing protein [Sphingomonas parva]|nr:DUF1697 domain-containing protein [Sphingomonas parva]
MRKYVALLRGINVGGHRKLPMAQLKAVAARIGLADVATYVASGNLVFSADATTEALEARLEEAIAAEFGFPVDVIVRSAADWAALAAANPFPKESAETPNFVMMTIGKQPASDAAVDALRAKAAADEKVERRGEALWIWFGSGAGRSKLGAAPAKGVWTARNWRTVETLRGMLAA